MKITVNALINSIWALTGILALICVAQSVFVA